MYSYKGCFSKSISTMDLLKWATQIANGMQYLESLGVCDFMLNKYFNKKNSMHALVRFG